jgi:broad specificity phosphatase PhoE
MSPTHKWFRALLIVGAVALTALSASAESPLTVFLVRHAEKAGPGGDPPLTEAGQRRAEYLAAMLADAGITTIFSSEYKRTRDTAAPLAKRLGVSVTVVPAKDMAALLSKVRALSPAGRALIVGHSDTVPALAHRLTGAKVAELTDADYDRLYVATVPKDGPGEIVVLHYGDSLLAGPDR